MFYQPVASQSLKALLKIIEVGVPYPFPCKNPFDSVILADHGVQWIEFQSAEETPPCNLTGWTCRPPSPVGTVFLLHGFRENSYNQYVIEAAERFTKLNLAVVAPDFRYHGKSEKRLPTFGFAESLDVAGAMNWAESAGYPKPFILYGGSLGALAAQVCAIRDARVSGAFLKSAPASAGIALANCVQAGGVKFRLPGQLKVLTSAINATPSQSPPLAQGLMTFLSCTLECNIRIRCDPLGMCEVLSRKPRSSPARFLRYWSE